MPVVFPEAWLAEIANAKTEASGRDSVAEELDTIVLSFEALPCAGTNREHTQAVGKDARHF